MKTKIFILFILAFSLLHSEIRYVSKEGLSKPPYTSWETASDSIQKCINICLPGDTIYVGYGIYEEVLILNQGLSLIGIDADSCIFNYVNNPDSNLRGIIVHSNTLVKNFTFKIHTNSEYKTGIFIDTCSNVIIENNKFYNGFYGISTFFSSTILNPFCMIKNNYFFNNFASYYAVGSGFSKNISIIENNYFFNNLAPIRMFSNANLFARNNFIFSDAFYQYGISCGYNDSAKIFNNLIITSKLLARGIVIWNEKAEVINNTILGNIYFFGIVGNPISTIKNNIVEGMDKNLSYGGIITTNSDLTLYNLSYGHTYNWQDFVPGSTNISVDPMLVNNDPFNYDAHLQMFSPAIDAGDPNILDVDGTRSDMGFFGGPYGEAYTYNDLAPRTPRALYGKIDSSKIRLAWKGGTERDFKHFVIYKDTTINFTPDSSKLVSVQRDTVYIDTFNPSLDKHYYYKITAVDSQGNVSLPSQEISFILLGISENDGELGNGKDYELYNNYPNPFNPSTSISFRMKKAGFVKLQVYNITGELVSIIKNEHMEAGYHEVEYSPKNIDYNDKASGIYILRLDIRGENNVPVYNDSKKMIYMK